MAGFELRIGRAIPCAHLLRRPVDQPAIMIAEHVDSIERHQRVHRPPRIERSARHVAEIDDLCNALRTDVGEHRFQREVVSMDVGNRGETHFRLPGRLRLLRCKNRAPRHTSFG